MSLGGPRGGAAMLLGLKGRRRRAFFTLEMARNAAPDAIESTLGSRDAPYSETYCSKLFICLKTPSKWVIVIYFYAVAYYLLNGPGKSESREVKRREEAALQKLTRVRCAVESATLAMGEREEIQFNKSRMRLTPPKWERRFIN